MHRREFLSAAALALTWSRSPGQEQPPRDHRPFKTLNSDFPLTVPNTLADWQARRERIRRQILVATGLWPMPERPPIQAAIHSPIVREYYTIEKVSFASRPGHYVSGNLYRPKGGGGPRPGVLFAHGHWAGGRLMQADDAQVAADRQSQAERTEESARYPMQAACATLARRGYVVFHYDMVGYADSTAIGHAAGSGVPHPNGFADLQGELWLQSLMGLQTWNSLRSLDFLTSLDGVDAQRIGMTGGSGGGTQTFILAAIDDRIACAVPAVMVSTGMQGGCVCENSALLRIGTGNVEFAALMAPRPLALTAANDWTRDLLTNGYPELQRIYDLYGKRDNLIARAWLNFPHNYNQPAREFMYAWFARHLEGKAETVEEPPFVPVPPAELRVYDAAHPRPADECNAAQLRALMCEADQAWLQAIAPTDAPSLGKYRQMLVPALRAMIADEPPRAIVLRGGPNRAELDGGTLHSAWIGRQNEHDALPIACVIGPKHDGAKVLLWLHPDGKASLLLGKQLNPAVRRFIDAGFAIVTADLYGMGELRLAKPRPVNEVYAGFTTGYNRTLLAERVHDVITLFRYVASEFKPRSTHVVGWGKTGLCTALACAAATPPEPDQAADLGRFTRAAFDLERFDLTDITSVNDERFLPGLAKYGGLDGLLAVLAPTPLAVLNPPREMGLVHAAYRALQAEDALTLHARGWPSGKLVDWLLKS